MRWGYRIYHNRHRSGIQSMESNHLYSLSRIALPTELPNWKQHASATGEPVQTCACDAQILCRRAAHSPCATIQTGGSFLPTSSRRCSSWQPTRRSYHEDSPGIHRDPLQRATLILRTPAAILNRSQVFPLDSDLSDHPVAGRNTLPSFRSARAHRTAVISLC